MFFEGVVLEEIWDKVKCEMINRSKDTSDEKFIKIFDKKLIRLNRN